MVTGVSRKKPAEKVDMSFRNPKWQVSVSNKQQENLRPGEEGSRVEFRGGIIYIQVCCLPTKKEVI